MTNKKVTTDHDEIKNWAEKHKAVPALIDDVDAGADKVGIRLDFPGDYDEKYLDEEDTHDIDWESFFKVFEEQELAFIYDNKLQSDPSWGYKFIKRENMDKAEEDE